MKNLARNMVFCGLLAAWPALAQPPQATILEKKPTKAPELPTLPTITWEELSAQIGGPTLVTLSAKEMPGAEAIDALAAQVPFAIQLQNRERWKDTKKTLTADYQAQPFWLAALDLAHQLGGDFREYNNRGVTFTPDASQKRGVVSRSGPSLFTLKRATYLRSVVPGETADDADEALSLSCTLYTDPKLQWQNNNTFIEVEEASDEKNQSLLLDKIQRINDNSIADFSLRLKPPATRGGKLQRLRGNFHGVVAAQSTNWEVPDVLKAKNVEKILKTGATTTRLELQDVTAEEENYLVTMVISQSGDQAQRVVQLANGQRVYLRDDLGSDKLSLLDDKDRELRVRSTKVQQSGDDQTRITTLSVTFAPNRGGAESQHTTAPAKLIMRYSSAWRELIVPFAFENVALP